MSTSTILDLRASPTQKLVLIAIANAESPSIPADDLARMTGLDPRSVRRAVREAERAGWLHVEPVSGAPNRYRLLAAS